MSKMDKTKNMGQVAKGKVKETVGKATGDKKSQAAGKMDQTKGNAKQAGEKIKDAFKK